MKDCIKRIKELEPLFSDNQYRGSGKTAFIIEEGQIPVMVSAPHAVKQFREGMIKRADIYTGGIARYLHEVTGCHLIYSCMFTESDPNYDIPGRNQYQDALVEYISRHRIAVLLDLHGAGKEREYAVEIGTVPRRNSVSGVVYETDTSLHEYKFIADLITKLFERNFASCLNDRRNVWKNRIFDAGHQNTITKYISENTGTACVQLEINGIYRDPDNMREFEALIRSLKELIVILAELDWNQETVVAPQV